MKTTLLIIAFTILMAVGSCQNLQQGNQHSITNEENRIRDSVKLQEQAQKLAQEAADIAEKMAAEQYYSELPGKLADKEAEINEASKTFSDTLKNFAQKPTRKFKLYSDTVSRFSFQLPLEWKIITDDETSETEAYEMDTGSSSSYVKNNEAKFAIETFTGHILDSAFLCSQGFSVFFYNVDTFKRGVLNYKSGANKYGDRYFIQYGNVDGSWDNLDNFAFAVLYFIKDKGRIACYRDYYSNTDGGNVFNTIYFFDRKKRIIKITAYKQSLDEDVKIKLIQSFKFF